MRELRRCGFCGEQFEARSYQQRYCMRKHAWAANRAAHREKRRIYMKTWHDANEDRERAYREEHRERLNDNVRRYRTTLKYALHHVRHTAKARGR